MIRMLEAMVIIALTTILTKQISEHKSYTNYDSTPLPQVKMKEMLKWLGHVLRMQDNKSPKIVLFS